MNDFFRSAACICNPLASPPNWPANPPDYYGLEAEARETFTDTRRREINDDPMELADALSQYLEQKPAEFVAAFKKSCGGTLQAAIDLQDLLDKAVDTYIDKEWNGNEPL